MRSLLRTSVAFGMALALLGGMFSLLSATPAHAESTTIEITDVYNSVNPSDEWFQLYNMTKGPLTLTGWSVCNSDTCLTVPTTTIESFSLAKFKASALTGWPTKGLDGANDMLGIKDDSGKPIDTLNWGAPSSGWKNYETFKAMLWNPGIKVTDANANQSFFRMAIGKDSDQVSDWLTTASRPPGAPQATATPASTSGGGTIRPATTPTPVPAPKTGGEFPIMLALGLILTVLLLRYFRRGIGPPIETK